MKKISFAVALLCGIAIAREDSIKITQDTTRVENAFRGLEELQRRLEYALEKDQRQGWTDVNHAWSSMRTQQYVNYGKQVKPWVDALQEWNRLTTVSPTCDQNKLEVCLYNQQNDWWAGVPESESNEQADACVEAAGCRSPLAEENGGSLGEKIETAQQAGYDAERKARFALQQGLRKANEAHRDRVRVMNRDFEASLRKFNREIDCPIE